MFSRKVFKNTFFNRTTPVDASDGPFSIFYRIAISTLKYILLSKIVRDGLICFKDVILDATGSII